MFPSSSIASDHRLTGRSFPADRFSFRQSPDFPADAMADVLWGRQLGVVWRRALSTATCRAAAEHFWRSSFLKRRPDAEASVLGAFHYMKPMDSYLAEVRECRAAGVFDGSAAELISETVLGRVREVLTTRGVTLRVARHGGEQAAPFVLRSWNFEGEFSLDPHEDMAQCMAPNQQGFEIQQVVNQNLVAANCCLENTVGAELCVWNIAPDQLARDRAGATAAGYPYDQKQLDSIECVQISVEPGDVYFFNGAFVHAVRRTRSSRTTLAFFLGLIDPATCAFWA